MHRLLEYKTSPCLLIFADMHFQCRDWTLMLMLSLVGEGIGTAQQLADLQMIDPDPQLSPGATSFKVSFNEPAAECRHMYALEHLS